MNEPKYTANELNKATASLLIVLGAHLPENLVKSMADMLTDLSGQIERGGEPTVARLTSGFAEALQSGAVAKKKHQH